MEKGYYKTFQLKTKTIEENGVFVGTLTLPKDVEFLSICGDSRYLPYEPTFCISVLGDFSKNEFQNYDFMIIWHCYNQSEIFLSDYKYIGPASLPNGNNSITSIKNFDVFVKES